MADSLQGVVEVSPLPPEAVLIRPGQGGPVQVTGDFATEIGHLTGSVVQAFGPQRASSPWPLLNATRYRLVSVNGQTPLVGTIRLDGARVWLDLVDSGGSVELAHAPALIARAGVKAYVLGPRTASGVAVEQFGVIKDAGQ